LIQFGLKRKNLVGLYSQFSPLVQTAAGMFLGLRDVLKALG